MSANTDTALITMTEIELIPRQYDSEKKCGMCGFRSTTLWNLGENEPEELAACGDCTTQHIAHNEEFTLHKTPDSQ